MHRSWLVGWASKQAASSKIEASKVDLACFLLASGFWAWLGFWLLACCLLLLVWTATALLASALIASLCCCLLLACLLAPCLLAWLACFFS